MRLILIFCSIFLKKFLAEKVLGSIENDNQLLIVLKEKGTIFLGGYMLAMGFIILISCVANDPQYILVNQTNFNLNLNTDCSTSLIAKFIELI